MRSILTWGLLILLAVGGIVGSYALSEAFRSDAREAWEAQATRVAQWLSATVLGWLEESYAPLSGLAILFENSREVSEVEFLGATDGLEARATTIFLDAKAIASPQADGDEWSIKFSNDPLGPLSPDMPLSRQPEIFENIKVALDHPDQVVLGRPFSAEDGSRYSPVALAIQDASGPLVVIGLVNYDAIVKGLFDIHKLDGLRLQIQGRFKAPDGPGDQREVFGKSVPEALYSVTTRTVSAGADLSITWYMDQQFGKGPKEGLANLTFLGGIVGTFIIAAFIAFFIQRNQTITRRVQEATAELKKVSEAVAQSPVSVVITAKDGTIEYVNPTFCEVTGYAAEEAIGQNPRVLKSGDLPQSFYKELWDTVLSGNVWQGEFINRKKSGEEFWESASISPIVNDEGEITHFVAVKEDITERKHTEEQQKENAARTRAIVDHAADGIITINEQRIIEEFNPAAERIFGYKAAEIIGQNVNMLMPEPHHSRHDRYVQNYLDTGKAKILGDAREMTARRKDGTTFPIYLAVSEVQLKDRRIFSGMVRDISELKQAEEAIKEKALQLRTIFDKSPIGILHFDNDGIVLDCNQRHAEIMGSTRGKIIGMNLKEEIKDEDLRAAVFGALAGEQTEFEAEYTSVSGGKTVAVRSLFNPTEPGTSSTDVINTTEDITERRKMEQELQERIEELDAAQSAMLNMMEDLDAEKARAEAATQAKSDFLANMSHEIRTPMNAVIGMAHLALKTDLSLKQRDYIEKIQSSANALLGIINDILDFSKIEAGKLDIETVDFNLEDVMDNLANLVAVPGLDGWSLGRYQVTVEEYRAFVEDDARVAARNALHCDEHQHEPQEQRRQLGRRRRVVEPEPGPEDAGRESADAEVLHGAIVSQCFHECQREARDDRRTRQWQCNAEKACHWRVAKRAADLQHANRLLQESRTGEHVDVGIQHQRQHQYRTPDGAHLREPVITIAPAEPPPECRLHWSLEVEHPRVGIGDDVGRDRQWQEQCPGEELPARKLAHTRQPGRRDPDREHAG